MKAIKFLLANAVLGLKEYSYREQKIKITYSNVWYEKYFTIYVLNLDKVTTTELFGTLKGIEVGEPLFSFLYRNPKICVSILWKAFKYYKVFISREKFRNIKSVDITALS
jgi:hypothetical protein